MKSDDSPPTNTIDWHSELSVNREWMFAIAMSRLRDKHEAEEIVQEVSLGVIQQTERPTGADSVRPWLYQFIVRRIADHLRSRYRRDALINGYAHRDAVVGESQTVDWIFAEERKNALVAALNQLPEMQRQVLALKYCEHCSYRKIGQRLGIAERKVEYLLVQGKQQLRRQLASLEEDYLQ